MFIDYYIILEVEPTCSQDELKKAYRTLAKKWHPDLNKNKDAGERMRQIIEAYTLLSDDEARYRYDLEYSRFNAFRKSKEESKQEPDNKKETKSEPSYEQEYEIKDEILKEWMTTAKKQANQFFKDLYGEIVKTGKNIAFGIKEGVISAIVLIVIVNIIYFTVQTIDPINNDSSYEGNDEVLEELNNVSRESRNPIIDKGNILKDFSKFIRPRLTNRKLKTNVIFGDLNGDGVDDAVVDYCIEATNEDRDVGGGNALMSLECMESGFAVYVKSGNSFYLKKDRDKSYFADEGSDYKAERIQNGKIFCTNDSYEDDDPRCCPSQKGSIYLVYENGELIKPAQIRLITTNESTEVRIESEVNLPEKINSYQDLEKIGFVILGQVAKDFNNDGWADRVIIIDKKNNEKDSRRILVYCSDGSPQCKLQTNNNKLILGEGDGGMISDPFSSIALNNNGDLEIKFEPDVNYRYTYTYRYLGEYKLIGFTDYWFSRTTIDHESVEKSINFLTGKTNIKSDPGNGDTPEENWHSFDTQSNQYTLREQQKPWSYEINGIEF